MTIEDNVCACTLDEWLKQGPQWLREHPSIREVRLTDRQPDANGKEVLWWLGCARDLPTYPRALPKRLFRYLPEAGYGMAYVGFPSTIEAELALSLACLIWAKEQAKTTEGTS